jgi:MFS family permease
MTRRLHSSTLLAIAAVLTLIGLALMVWSMLEPTPMPVILAMSVGQGLGTVALAMFGYTVLVDQIRKQRARGAHAARPATPAAPDELVPAGAAAAVASRREAPP